MKCGFKFPCDLPKSGRPAGRLFICWGLSLCLSFIGASAWGQALPHEQVRKAVERQMQVYPLSTLQDLYKNFFQDRFGPGHLVNDTASASAYLRRELAEARQFEGALYEPTGYMGNFYRVNLRVIHEGRIDYATFFDAFVRSVNGIIPLPVDEWRKEWKQINGVISEMDLKLDGYARDSVAIDSLLRQGKYVMHHSRRFEKTYDPHYRIISREIFEKELLPQLCDDRK